MAIFYNYRQLFHYCQYYCIRLHFNGYSILLGKPRGVILPHFSISNELKGARFSLAGVFMQYRWSHTIRRALQIQYNREMAKLIVLCMDREYPFTEDHVSSRESYNILVRQTLHTPRMNKNTILAKANFLKNLKNKYLVKVDSLLEEQESIHIMYEYIENKLSNVLKEASMLLINKIYAQLHEFGRYLSNIGVRILFNVDRMGFTAKECLKYFMGLDFEWEEDPDQEFLEQFYDKQADQILGDYMKKGSSIVLHGDAQMFMQPPVAAPYSISTHSNSREETKLRKISYSTLPSRYNRFNKIDQKLREIKSSTRLTETQKPVRKPTSVQTPKINNISGGKGDRKYGALANGKKFEDRKYSGQVKYQFESHKLFEKESDIQSEYWQRKKKSQKSQTQQQNRSEAETNKTKSRTEEMKEKQYKQISSMKKDYLKDFISVLEEEEDNAVPQTPIRGPQAQQKVIKYAFKKTNSLFVPVEPNSSEDLQLKAKEAIEHSLKVMSKFKTLLQATYETHQC